MGEGRGGGAAAPHSGALPPPRAGEGWGGGTEAAQSTLPSLVAVPLAAGGAFGALLITGMDVSLSVLICQILLIGIAMKSSILLVD